MPHEQLRRAALLDRRGLRAPTLTAPANADVLNTTTPAFTWTGVGGAAKYHIQIDDNSDFSSPVIDDNTLITNSYTAGSALTAGVTYYWRVSAINAGGAEGAWSAARVFTLYAVYDTFTAADGTNLNGHAPDIGPAAATWLVSGGSYAIQGNKALNTAIGTAFIESNKANCVIEADVTTGTGTAFNASGLYVRVTDSSHGWYCYLDATGNTLIIYQVDGASETVRATAAKTLAANTTYRVRVVLSGPTITMTVDGGNQISYNSSFNQTATKHGVRSAQGGTVTSRAQYEDFKVIPT